MKKVLLLVLAFVFLVCNACFAGKDEYVVKNYDFKSAKRVFVDFRFLEQQNGIDENEAFDIFFEKTTKVVNNLKAKGYTFHNINNLAMELKKEKNIDIWAEDRDYGREIISYIKDHYDSYVSIYVGSYGMGTTYKEGYYMSVPSTTTTNVTGNVGSTPVWGTATTYGTRQQYIPGGNVRTVYCSVKFEVVDIATNRAVWTAIDNRYKALTALEHSKPKGMYSRIIDSFLNDYEKRLSQ